MNGLIGIGGVLALLLAGGGLIGLASRRRVRAGWLLAAALLVLINDALLTRCYGLIPDLLPALDRNWQGKLMALAATLAIAALPAFGWRRAGLTLEQKPRSWRSAVPVALLYGAFFVALAAAFPNGPLEREDLAFQLTMPGLEEELFYRGVLLFALDRAFTGRVRLLGIEWGWGAVLSSLLFGLAHAFGYGAGGFSLDLMILLLTAGPSLIAVWVRVRTGSLLLPVLMHNFGNTVMLLV